MKFSAQEEYGLRCLLALAKQGPGRSLTIPEISEMEGMTTSHVAKILSILRKAGFIKSTRGQLGGYTMAMPASQMVLRDVLEPLGGRMFGDGFCERHAGILNACVHETDCMLRPLWTSIQQAVDDVVGAYTVQDLMDNKVCDPTVHLTLAGSRSHPAEAKEAVSSNGCCRNGHAEGDAAAVPAYREKNHRE